MNKDLYTDINSPMLQHHQPLEIFSQLYPNFDYYWQLEMDSRITGHTYHFLDKAISFAKQQPRKFLWERTPTSIHRLHMDPGTTSYAW